MKDTERCHAEQARAAAYLAENPQGAEVRGAQLSIADWMAEEVLINAENAGELKEQGWGGAE